MSDEDLVKLKAFCERPKRNRAEIIPEPIDVKPGSVLLEVLMPVDDDCPHCGAHLHGTTAESQHWHHADDCPLLSAEVDEDPTAAKFGEFATQLDQCVENGVMSPQDARTTLLLNVLAAGTVDDDPAPGT